VLALAYVNSFTATRATDAGWMLGSGFLGTRRRDKRPPSVRDEHLFWHACAATSAAPSRATGHKARHLRTSAKLTTPYDAFFCGRLGTRGEGPGELFSRTPPCLPRLSLLLTSFALFRANGDDVSCRQHAPSLPPARVLRQHFAWLCADACLAPARRGRRERRCAPVPAPAGTQVCSCACGCAAT